MDITGLTVHDTASGCRLRVRVKPSAKQDTITAVHAGLLKMTVCEAPERGRANAAVARVLAGILNIGTSRVHVVSGFTTSDKLVEITGCSSAEVRRRLESTPRISAGRR